MCRNIKPLFNYAPPATNEEIHEASLQFVRKISGFSRPSGRNVAAFEAAVADVSTIVTRLLADLETSAPPRDRVIDAERARERSNRRFGRTAAEV